MKESMGADYADLADYFDACRIKRNVIDYDRAGGISEGEAEKLLREVRQFREIILNWLQSYYPRSLKQGKSNEGAGQAFLFDFSRDRAFTSDAITSPLSAHE